MSRSKIEDKKIQVSIMVKPSFIKLMGGVDRIKELMKTNLVFRGESMGVQLETDSELQWALLDGTLTTIYWREGGVPYVVINDVETDLSTFV